MKVEFSLFAAALLGMAGVQGAAAAEIRVLSTGAFKAVVLALVPEFEKQTGHKVVVDNGTVGQLQKRVDEGEQWQQAWRAAADVATDAAKATAELRPKVGRARPLAERSVGTPDAGATSLAMCAHTVADCFTLTTKGE